MQINVVYLGADVAQNHIDLHAALAGLPKRIANTPKALRSLLKALGAVPLHVVCEATGGCERLLVDACHKAQIPISVLNPRKLRNFALAKGQIAKTDPIDARLLCEYGSTLHPVASRPADPTLQKLAALTTRRRQLLALRTAESNRLLRADPLLLSSHRRVLRSFDKEMASLQKTIDQIVASCPWLGAKVATLSAVRGIGPTSAIALLAALPELGSLSKNQAASLAGLAPFNRDSGISRGKRHIHGGRLPARCALYMPALVASRHNPVIRLFYQRLLANGKPPKIALTASMRKLLIHLNSLLKPSQ